MTQSPTSDETQLRALLEELTEGVRTKDAARATGPYASHTVMYVLDPPLQHVSGDAANGGTQGVEAWFATFQDAAIGQEIRDLHLTVGAEVAFAYRLVRLSGTRTDGTHTSVWTRETFGFQKLGGEWKITHQHQSVPMYMDGSNRAALDLQP